MVLIVPCDRGKDGAPVICGESSVTDGFGLHLVNRYQLIQFYVPVLSVTFRFLNVPFLLNQRKYAFSLEFEDLIDGFRILLAQLDTNKMESEGTEHYMA